MRGLSLNCLLAGLQASLSGIQEPRADGRAWDASTQAVVGVGFSLPGKSGGLGTCVSQRSITVEG